MSIVQQHCGDGDTTANEWHQLWHAEVRAVSPLATATRTINQWWQQQQHNSGTTKIKKSFQM